MASFTVLVLLVLHLSVQVSLQASPTTTAATTTVTGAVTTSTTAIPNGSTGPGSQQQTPSKGVPAGSSTTTSTQQPTTTIPPGRKGGACTSLNACSDTNADCKHGHCECKTDYVALDGDDCKLKIGSKANCSKNDDCTTRSKCDVAATGKCVCDETLSVSKTDLGMCGLIDGQTCTKDGECVNSCKAGHCAADNAAGRVVTSWLLLLSALLILDVFF